MLSLFLLMLAGRPRPGRGVDVPMKLLFGAGQQPLDVAPVAPDHKGRYRRRQDGIQPVMAQQENTDTGMLAVAATEPRDT